MRLKHLLFLFLLFCFGCKKDIGFSGSEKSNGSLISFKFESGKNLKLQNDVVADINDTTISCTLPSGVSPDSLVATFETNPLVYSVTIGSVEQETGLTMNNYTKTIHYNVYGRDNLMKTYLVKVNVFTGLPVIYITTNNDSAIVTKESYVNGQVSIDGNYTGLGSLTAAAAQIKLHGNYTLTLPKKAYKIKFASKTSVFGFPADKEWILLANYTDKTLMRNDLAFHMSKVFGMAYTPNTQFVELYLNGTYQGNYELTDDIKISSGRVNIKEMSADDTTATKITGGYLFEVDQREDGDVYFETSRNVDIVLHDPDLGVAAQTNYIKNYVQQVENSIYAANFADPAGGYNKYLNAESAISWFWVNELFKNEDSKFGSSVWMYKDRGGLLNFGPAWDFDIGAGNSVLFNCDDPTGWYLKDCQWYSGLFHDPAFTQKAIAKWKSVHSQLDSLNYYIDQNAFKLKYSQARNFEVWNILKTYVIPNTEVAGSYDAEVTFLKQWLSRRIKWIDENLQTLQN